MALIWDDKISMGFDGRPVKVIIRIHYKLSEKLMIPLVKERWDNKPCIGLIHVLPQESNTVDRIARG